MVQFIIVLTFRKTLLISSLTYLLGNLIYLSFSLYLPLDFLVLYFLIKGSTLFAFALSVYISQRLISIQTL